MAMAQGKCVFDGSGDVVLARPTAWSKGSPRAIHEAMAEERVHPVPCVLVVLMRGPE